MRAKTKTTKSAPGYSFVALIKQALHDGRVHSTQEIASYMRRHVGQTGPLKNFEKGTVLPLLQSRRCFEKIGAYGYVLGSGNEVNDPALELLLAVRAPMTIKGIMQRLRHPDGPPVISQVDPDNPDEVIFIEQPEEEDYPVPFSLDNDGRFIDFHLLGNVYWYPSQLLDVRDFVRDLVRRFGPIRNSEIFTKLKSEFGINEDNAIFMVEMDPHLELKSRRYHLIADQEEEVLVLTREDYDPVLYHLREDGRTFSLSALNTAFFHKPLSQTDLSALLHRQDSLIFEGDACHARLPVQKLPLDEFRVEAVLDKATKTFTSSPVPLPLHLLVNQYFSSDLSSVAGLHAGLIERLSAEFKLFRTRAGIRKWNVTDAALYPSKEDLKRLEHLRLSPFVEPSAEADFIRTALAGQWKEDDETQILEKQHGQITKVRCVLSYNQALAGVLCLDSSLSRLVPFGFPATGMMLIDTTTHARTPLIVDTQLKLITGFKEIFAALPNPSGTLLYCECLLTEPFSLYFTCHPEEIDPLTTLEAEKVATSEFLRQQTAEDNLTLFDLIWLLMVSRGERKAVHRNMIWAEINVIRRATRREVAAVLESHACFLQQPEDRDFSLYFLDPSIPPGLK